MSDIMFEEQALYTQGEQELIDTIKQSNQTLSHEVLETKQDITHAQFLELLESTYDYSQIGDGQRTPERKARVLRAYQNSLRSAGIDSDESARSFITKLVANETLSEKMHTLPKHPDEESQESTPQESTQGEQMKNEIQDPQETTQSPSEQESKC